MGLLGIMATHTENVSTAVDIAAAKTITTGVVGVGIGAIQAMELFQNVLVSVGSICGAVLVIWTLVEKIRQSIKKRNDD